MDLLLEAMAYAGLHNAGFRKALPPGFARPEFDRAQAQETFRNLLETATTQRNFNAALDRFVDEFLSTRPPVLVGQMAQMPAIDRLTINDLAGARPGVSYGLRSEVDHCAIYCYGRKITFPSYLLDTLQFALSHSRFVVCELPGGLDAAGKLTLVRRLIREGLLVAL